MNSTPTVNPATSVAPASQSAGDARSHEVYLLDLSDQALPVAQEGARLAFPHANIRAVKSLQEIQAGRGDCCLVVLGNADAAATLAAEPGGVPRCAVVVLGQDPSEIAETVPPSEWNAPLLARVFRSALLEQELLRENIRLRGDLKTVARRISHDLRTPLGCIYTTSGVFKELPPGDAESVASMAAIIKESGTEISQIVDRVSFILKASADPLTPSRVDMGGVVATVLNQLGPELRESNAHVTLPSSWPEALGVTSWLQVVWSNLLKNAVQHGGPSADIRVTWQPEENSYRFSVTDRGVGIGPARVDSLFSPFEQLHALHVPGLGLSYVQRLISLQGGQCAYENGSEGGACFYFTLPSAR